MIRPAAFVVATTVVLLACGGGRAEPEAAAPISTTTAPPPSTTSPSTTTVPAPVEVVVDAGSFRNINDMTPVRGFFVDNLLGDLERTFSDEAEAAQWLIDHGADVDLRHDFGGAEHGKGATALHLAAQFGSEACIEVLLAAGADRTVEDENFRATPAEWATHVGNDELAERLAASGG